MIKLKDGDIKAVYASIDGKARLVKNIFYGVGGKAITLYAHPLLLSRLDGEVKMLAGETLGNNSPSYIDNTLDGLGKVASFTGNEYVAYKLPFSLTTQKQYTVEGWFNFTNISTNRNIFLIGANDLKDNGNFALRLYRAPSGTVGLACFSGTGSGGGFYTRFTSSVALSGNKWHHLALEIDMTGNKASFYVGGVKYAFTQAVQPNSWLGASNKANADRLYIGTPTTFQQQASYTQRQALNFIGYVHSVQITEGLYYNK